MALQKEFNVNVIFFRFFRPAESHNYVF